MNFKLILNNKDYIFYIILFIFYINKFSIILIEYLFRYYNYFKDKYTKELVILLKYLLINYNDNKLRF